MQQLGAVAAAMRVSWSPVSAQEFAARRGGVWRVCHHATTSWEARLCLGRATTGPAGDGDGLLRRNMLVRLSELRVAPQSRDVSTQGKRARLTSTRVMQPRYINAVDVFHG
jgi:hypothetical protein